jgi:hypothetical protein
MAKEQLAQDDNSREVAGAITNDSLQEIRNLRVDPTTGRLLVDSNLTVQDIQIGAVEIKDSTTDNRVTINSSGELKVQSDQIGAVSDSAATADTGSWSIIALLKWLLSKLSDSRGSGTIAAQTINAVYNIALSNGRSIIGISVTNLTSTGATLTIEASDDGGTNWNSVNGIVPGTGNLFSTLTTDQQFRVNVGGRTNLRLRVSTAGSSANINVVYSASKSSSAVALSSPIPQGTNTIGNVGGIIDAAIVTTFTRMTNTTAYLANQMINNLTSGAANRSLSNVAKSIGSSGYLKLILLSTMTGITPRIRVHLYDATPTTAKNDGATWTFDTTNDINKYLGYVDMDAMNGGVATASVLLPYKANASARDIFFELQTLDGFTPTSAAGFTLKAIPDQNNV